MMLKHFCAVTALSACVLTPALSQAASKDLGQFVSDPLTLKECGDCHMAFPPVQLTAGGWKKIMADLANHFGEDATLPASDVKHIEAYLVKKSLDGGGTMWGKMTIKRWKKKGLIDPIRITETPGWRGAHKGSKKYARMAQDVGYDKGANCIKCHTQADKGIFEEFENLYPELGGHD